MRTFATLFAALALLAPAAPAIAQDAPPPQQTESMPAAPTWEGLPFTSLADYESKIPIGMSRRDLMRTLGRPEATTPGMGDDEAYHYLYNLADGRQLRAVIILRDHAVFIRRLYILMPDGGTSRVN